MIAIVAWLFAGVALWFTRGVLDVFDDAGRSTRVAMLPSAPELAGLIVLCLVAAGGLAAVTGRWTRSPAERREALLQISLPLFGLTLVAIPYMPWLPDAIAPLRSLSGPIVYIIWFVVAGQAFLTFFSVRAGFRGWPASPRGGAIGAIMASVVAAALSAATALRIRGTLAAVALAGSGPISADGFHAPLWISVLLTAVMAWMLWRWTFAFTGSSAAAAFAWAAIFLGAPVLFTSVAMTPDIPAAFCMMVAIVWRSGPQRPSGNWGEALIRGLAVSLLPWLSLTYTPMAAAALVVLGLRLVKNPRAVAAVLVPFTVSLVRRLLLPHPPLAFANPIVGMLGLLFDQEFGVLAYAPALALGLTGLWSMNASRDQMVPRRGGELAIVFCALLISTGARTEWWGGLAPPGRPLVPVLPLLGLPIAWTYLGAAEASVRRAAYQLLALIGIAVSCSMLMTEQGYLIVQDRDGSSRFLQWLTMLWPVWLAAPAPAASGLKSAGGLIALWVLAAFTVAWISRRNPLQRPGASALMSLVNISAAVVVVALVAPAMTRAELPSLTEPEARSRLPMLDDFDSLARPHAIVYRPFSIRRAADIPPLLKLEASPGLRSGGQPVRVLLNGRFALAAGDYTVEIGGLPAAVPVTGTVALQVGRIGGPVKEWTVELAPGSTWRADFSIPVDAEFVGFITSGALADATLLRITPLRIVDKNNRESSFHGQPRIVLSSVGFPSASVFFHDEDVYPERNGFWVHGESTAFMTIASKHPEAGVTIRVHSGSRPNSVTFATTTWGERVQLVPGTPRDIHVPAPARPGPFLLRVTTEKGFVPGDVLPGSSDRRILGCWIEIAEE